MAGELVVGYDGTDGSRAAIAEAGRLAQALGVGIVVGYGYGVPPGGGETADLSATLQELGERSTAAAVSTLQAAGVPVRAELVADRPAEALVRLAETVGAQMIIVGSHGETPLRGAILGSTPYRLLHLSQLPVLVVRRPE